MLTILFNVDITTALGCPCAEHLSQDFVHHRQLRLPEDVDQTLKILVMMPKQLASELASEEQAGPADNTLDAGMWGLFLVDNLALLLTYMEKASLPAGRHMLKSVCWKA